VKHRPPQMRSWLGVRRTRAFRALFMAGLLLGFGSACSDPKAPAAPTPAVPTVTDTFTGTLVVGGDNSHPFTVSKIGGITVTLTDVKPPALVGLGIGTPSGTSCALLSSDVAVAGISAQISGTATVVGTLCVAVFDAGNLVESATYTISVLHP
jgi:hypothetical protein